MKQYLLLFRLVILLGLLGASPADSFGQRLEFWDDFSKPAGHQFDPWEERIETERHDFTQSAVTVGRGVFQVESGYSYFYKDKDDEIEASHTGPEMLLRYGVTEDIEVRVRWNYIWQFVDVAEDESGSEDLRYSLKLQLTRQAERGYVPTSALEVRGTAPTGGEAYSTGNADFGLDYIYQWQLFEGVTFGGSIGAATNALGDFGLVPDEPANENFNVLSRSAVIGLELTESNTMYAEWFGIYSDGLEDEFVISVFNMGVDHYVTENLVIDFRAGIGLSEDADDFFSGVGGGFRF